MNANEVTRITAPASAILSIDEVKLHLNITHDDEDALLERLVDAATAMIDGPNGIGRAMITQTYRLTVDYVDRVMTLPIAPVQSVSSVMRAKVDAINLAFSDSRHPHLEALRMGLKGLGVVPADPVEGEGDE